MWSMRPLRTNRFGHRSGVARRERGFLIVVIVISKLYVAVEVHVQEAAGVPAPPPEWVEAAVDDVERRLSERGLRHTAQRRAVLRVLLESGECLSAAQVHEAARKLSPELGLMTVYRALDILAQMDVVRRVHGADRCEAFVVARGRHGHSVVCMSCGRASQFTDCHLEAVAAAAASETGFAIADHFLQFSGVCRDCQGAAAVTPAASGVRAGEAGGAHAVEVSPQEASSQEMLS
jgi:Fe2+ or Zn2+ uptake regulation protein